MAKKEDTPENLRPYLFHGLELDWSNTDKEAIGDCPFCGREGKFSVNVDSGLWRCLVCNEGKETGEVVQGGNVYIFLRMLWEKSHEATEVEDYRLLAEDRQLLNADTPMQWGAARSILSGEWILPGYNAEAAIVGLYKYAQTKDRTVVLACPTLGLPLFGMNLFERRKQVIYVCEGVWDGMALWEILGQAKETESGIKFTANREVSLLNDANVLAVAGTSAFYESWLPLFKDKTVILLYDNDHPGTHPTTGEQTPPAGLSAVERVAGILSKAPEPPAELHYVKWGEEGFNLDLPHGHDVRDYLNGT